MSAQRRLLLAQMMLGLLVLRAYVPAGFMPQTGNPLQLQLCSSSSAPAIWILLGQAPGQGSHTPDCPFSHASVSGPAGEALVPRAPPPQGGAEVAIFESLPTDLRVHSTHQARAPPALA